MKISIYFFLLIFFILPHKIISANEIEIISDNVEILDNGKTIKSINTKAIIEKEGLEIRGKQSLYNKDNQEVIFKKNVLFFDKIKNIIIETEEALFNKKKNILNTRGKTKIILEDNYKIISNNVFYDRKLQKIYSNDETTINDQEGNIYNIQKKIILDIKNEIVSSKNINIIDIDNNIYLFENAKVNLASKEILGKEIRIDFEDGYFGNKKNDPILKGRSALSNKSQTKIYKTVFSTCNTENKSCPGWSIETEEFTHDKINKVFNYKNSWLKVFDKEIFYFPFFSHPDPTVKRKSGFLVPYYGNSNNFGSWINIPYFKTLGKDKDMTFNPRFYADDKFILQSEYRQSYKNSNLISDFSYNNDGKNSNTHLFANLSGKIDQSTKVNFSYQSVSNDNYLKIHDLSKSSALIKDESLLTTQLNFSKKIDNSTNLTADFISYEDLSKTNNDRFQYIFPYFTFTKNIELDDFSDGTYQFKSSGFQKNYDTNKYETLLINDFLFNSKNFVNNFGIVSNYDLLLKNFNSYTENSSSYKNKEDYEIFGSFLMNTELPMKRIRKSGNDFLKPILSFRYSPNNTKNISNKDLRLSYANIFSLNRIGSNEIVEGGKSISLGFEYLKQDNNNNNFFEFKIANSLRDKKNSNLPIKSNLSEKRSDIVGKASYIPNKFLSLDYSFSYDNNFKSSNYDALSLNADFNLFSTSFNFLSEDDQISDNEILTNTSELHISDEKSIKFNITKNLKNDFTEFYDLIYQYETDCLKISLDYNKKFYSDGNLKPEKNLFFSIKFIPFAEFRQEAGFEK